MYKYDNMELARIIGEPVDPRRRYPNIVNTICQIDSADPNEYTYQFDVLFDTDTVYTITSNGVITSSHVQPDTPTLMTFVDIASPEYFMKVTELAKSKEQVLARKKKTINRAMHAWESYYVLNLINSACVLRGNVWYLNSGETSFNYSNIIDMIDQIIDYSENYVLVAGTRIDKDLKLMDWNDSHESLVSVMIQCKFDCISGTPNNRTILREVVIDPAEITRRTSLFQNKEDDMIRSAWQHVEVDRNDQSIFSKN